MSSFCGHIRKKHDGIEFIPVRKLKCTQWTFYKANCYKECCIITVKLLIKNGSTLITVSGFSLSAKALSQRGNKRTMEPVTVTKAKQFLSVLDATENKQLISYWDLYFIHCWDMGLPNYRLTCVIPKSSNKAIRKSQPIPMAVSDNALSKAIWTQSR